jgi:hypothetical protein
MPLLYASNKLQYPPSLTGGAVTTTSFKDAAFSDHDTSLTAAGHFIKTPVFSEQTEVWMGFRIGTPNLSTPIGRSWITLYDANGDAFAKLEILNASTLIYKVLVGGVFTSRGNITNSFTAGLNTYHYQFVLDDTEGSVKIYNNTLLVGTLTDIDTLGDSGATGGAQLSFHKPAATTSSSTYTHVSELTVANEDNRLWRVFSLPVNAAGSTSDFSGAYTAVDEINASDTDFIGSGETGQISTFNIPDLPAGSWQCHGVSVKGRARRASTGPAAMQYVTRVDGNNYTKLPINLTTDFEHLSDDTWDVSPATGLPWTETELNELEIGVRSDVGD